MSGRAVVVGQVCGPGLVVFLEAPDVLGGRAAEGVDVLVIVSNGEDGEFLVVFVPGASGQRRYQIVLVPLDVLVLVHQDPTEAGQQAVPLFVGILGRCVSAVEEGGGLDQDLVKVSLVGVVHRAGEAGADQAHGQSVAGEDGDAVGPIADQVVEPLADLHRGVAVVGQGQNGTEGLPPDADQVGDAVHQHPGLARSRTGQHQDVGAFAVVGHDAALDRIVQALNDPAPGFGGGLALKLLAAAGQPLVQEAIPGHAEVVQGQVESCGHGVETLVGVLGHNVDLQDLLVIVHLQGGIVRLLEAAPSRLQADGHGRPEDGEPFVQPYDLLVVEPQESLVQQSFHVPDPGAQQGLGIERAGQLTHGGLDQQVGAPGALGQSGQKVLQDCAGGLTPDFGGPLEGAPFLHQGDLDGLVAQGAQAQAARALGILPVVVGYAPETALDQLGAGRAGGPGP